MKKIIILLTFLIMGVLSFSHRCMATRYLVIDNKVYYVGQSEDRTKYYPDKEPLLMKDADAKTVVLIGQFGIKCEIYYKDKSRVYYMDEALPDSDPATFEHVGVDFITKDKNHVYYKSTKLVNLDAKTFELVSKEVNDKGGIFLLYDEVFKDKNGEYTNEDIEKMAEKKQISFVEIINKITSFV